MSVKNGPTRLGPPGRLAGGPGILRLIEIAEYFECGLDELLVGISPAPDDQAKHIASLLHGLKRADRHHIVKIVEKIVLIAKGKIKIDT